ncbi:MAG: hypothetical protein D6689_09720 [Deltaproteobacteria bacterium]|nr:MAG: hypothetical protein D6689_09720 [Deltaproteobacteria bacterium]
MNRSIVLAASAALATAALACGDGGACGPGDAPADGVTAAIDGAPVAYGNFTASANNDCTPPGAAIVSLTVDAVQVAPAPTGAFAPHLTLCIPRPDAVGDAPATLGLDDDADIRLVDLNAQVDDCAVALDRTAPVDATATLAGYCDDGAHPAGFAIALAGTVAVTRDCGGVVTAATATLGGRAAVAALSP